MRKPFLALHDTDTLERRPRTAEGFLLKNMKIKTFFHKPKGIPKRKKAAAKKYTADIVYESPAASLSGTAKIIGFILRALVLYVGVFGTVSFLCAAAGLTTQVHWQACYISYGYIALASLLVCAAAAISSLNRYTCCTVPPVFCGAVIGICAISHGNPVSFLWHSILRIYNFTLYHLAGLRYNSLGNFMVPDGLDYGNAGYMHADPQRFWGVFLLTVLIGILLSLFMLKKVRLIPLCTVIALIVIPVFTYNISKDNIGIGCLIAFSLGCIVLKIYDYRYAGPQSRKTARHQKRHEKKEQRKKTAFYKKEEKKALHLQADEILRASLDADMDKRRSRMARNAVFIAWRQAQKDKKTAAKKEVQNQKKQRKTEKKAARKAIAAEKKELAALQKAGDLQGASALQRVRETRNKERKTRRKDAHRKKQAMRAEKSAYAFAVSAAGGFAGFGAAAAALLALWIPMAAAKNSFPIIPPINNKVQIARSYVTAYLTGNDVDLNDLSAYGINELTPRALSFDPLEYKEKRILRVETTGQNSIYLRSWVGSDFDSQTNTWSAAEYDRVLEYRSLFGKDFTPDEITYNFNKYVYPSSVEITEENVYKNLTKYGFAVQQVHVQRMSGSSLLLFVPAHMNPEIGLCAWGGLEDAEYKYSNYYDGIYSSRFYKSGTGYSTVSFITALNRSEAGASRQQATDYYSRAKDFIAENTKRRITDDQLDQKIAEFDQQLAADGIEYIGTNLVQRYFYEMTEEEQQKFQTAVQLEEQYRTYAEDTYTKQSDSLAVKEIAAEILAQAAGKDDAYMSRHDLVMAVVHYLGEHYTYTKTPDDSADTEAGNILDAFLSEVKEGYCSHFATAAVAILREYNIPVRFVEGYVASDFSRASSSSGASYRCDVKDSNAHAWIEVYFDGMGWMQYEVTPGEYSTAMYDPSSATITPVVPGNQEEEPKEPIDPPQTTPAEPDNEEATESDNDLDEPLSEVAHFFLVIGITACLVLLGFIIYLIIRYIQKKAQLMLEKRYRVINLARNKEAYEKADHADRHKTVRQINDWILDIFRIMGFPPETGELPMDFAKRVSTEYATLSTEDFTQVMTYIQKEEFGHGLSAREAEICGEYLSDLIASVYAGLSLWQKIRVRYIKRIL